MNEDDLHNVLVTMEHFDCTGEEIPVRLEFDSGAILLGDGPNPYVLDEHRFFQIMVAAEKSLSPEDVQAVLCSVYQHPRAYPGVAVRKG